MFTEINTELLYKGYRCYYYKNFSKNIFNYVYIL